MRIADRFDVPWSAYTVAFSGDGERLAVGGGSWYAQNNGLVVIELATQSRRETDLRGRTVSGLAWSRDDRHLFASTWGSSQRALPAVALRVTEHDITEVDRIAIGGGGTPTGVVTIGSTAVVRTARSEHRDALMVKQWKADRDPDPVQHLTGNRVVVAKGRAITGNHLIQLERGEPLRSGLLTRDLGGGPAQHIYTKDLQRITAIGITADGMPITGSETGELDQWSFTPNGPLPTRRLGVIPLPIALPEARWITYRPSAVVGICCLEDGRIAAVTAGGMLAISRTNENLVVMQLAVPGTPRSIAAHPDRAQVAVGFKRGGFSQPESHVAIVEIDPETIDPALRTERVLSIAKQADAAAFGVLADALEELGAAPHLHAHVRRHDPRCKRCWVIDRLLEQ